MTEQKVFPHRLSLNERKELTVTGVTEVVSFDEETAVMKTSLGALTVHGRQLQLKNLSTNGGQVEVSGTVSALIYQQNKPTGSWVRPPIGLPIPLWPDFGSSGDWRWERSLAFATIFSAPFAAATTPRLM